MRPLEFSNISLWFLGKAVMGLAQDFGPLNVSQAVLFRSCRGSQKGSWGRGFMSTTGGPLIGRKVNVEKLWREFFSDPSSWWDHRSEKANSQYPDFKHKITQQSLWLNSKSTPSWVAARLAAMAPGTLQSSIFSWNIRLQRYTKAGDYKKTMDLFQQMQREGMSPNKFTYAPVLGACSALLALEEGRSIHLQIVQRGFECDVFVGSCLVDMYGKCGRIEEARRVFDKMPTRDVVSWNALILAYVKCRQEHKALELFRQMQCEGVDLSSVTFVGVVNACASIGALEDGRRAHEDITNRGYESITCVANSLVDMYAKCGSIEDAQRVFNMMPVKDVVSCNTLILGYVKCGQGKEALELSQQMQWQGLDLDPVTFVGVLNACALLGALEEGRSAHGKITKRGYESDLYVANSLVDMYVKCGSIDDAQRVFDKMSLRNVVSWSAMLAGYCRYGFAKASLGHFEQMCQEVEVDGVTFLSLLSACSHGGLVDEGMHYFESMTAAFNISPTLEHYASIIDLLGRAGHLHEAEDLIREMPYELDLWMSLLGACRIHGNAEMGERVAKQVLSLNPGNAAGHVLLSNIYAAAGKWNRVEWMRGKHQGELDLGDKDGIICGQWQQPSQVGVHQH